MPPIVRPGVIVAAMLLPCGAWAATPDGADEPDQIVITATRHGEKVRTAPATATVIDRKEIAQQPSADLLDAVRDVPGVTLAPRQVGGRKTFSLRGLEGKHTLTLIDGRRISASDDVVGHSDYQYGWMPLSAIERVEVIRGPLSSLYGSEALGGVVNLVTRWPSERWEGRLSLSGETPASGRKGGQGYKASAYAAGPLSSGLAARANFTRHHVGSVPFGDGASYSEIEGRSGTGGGASLRFTPVEGQRFEAGWQGGREDRFSDERTYAGKSYSNRYQLDRTHMWGQWQGSFGGGIETQLRAYRSTIDIQNSRTNNVAPTRPQFLADTVIDGHVQGEVYNHRLTLGGEWRRESLENAGLKNGKDSADHRAIFVQDDFTITRGLKAVIGIRADEHEIFGHEFSPRAYIVWQPSEALVIKGGYGRAFKAPTLKQISPNYVGAEGPHTFYGNKNVRPETAQSWEIGADWRQGPVSLRGVYFRSDIDDLITFRLLRREGHRRFYIYDNVNRARVEGVEAGATLDIGWGLRWNNDVTYLKTRDRGSDRPLPDRPEWNWTSQLIWESDGYHARAGMAYVGKHKTLGNFDLPAYQTFNLRAGHQAEHGFGWSVGIDNLTNVRLANESPDFGYAIRGRTLSASLQFGF